MLPIEDWLEAAKATPLGRSRRVYHLNENRPNLVVYNEDGEWSAYCHKCHDSGRKSKTHVILRPPVDARKPDTTLPQDAFHVLQAGKFCEDDRMLASFLVSKNMVPSLLPPMWYSRSRRRLIVPVPGGLLGRDVSGMSTAKWISYTNSLRNFELGYGRGPYILVEDTFSAFKVWRACPESPVICTLGTDVQQALLLRMRGGRAFVMYDGDSAGGIGAMAWRRHALPGQQITYAVAPNGLDPKDMEVAEIRAHLKGVGYGD